MENAHIVARFDKDLGKIKTRILEMGTLVIAQIKESSTALDSFDAGKVDRLIATDRRINGMNKDIHTAAERLIALRQPVALDLRQAILPINMAGELERIGDHAKSTAKLARKLSDAGSDPQVMAIVQQMSVLVQDMLANALIAYSDSDLVLSAEIRQADKDVDRLNKSVFATALQAISERPAETETLVRLILLARNFERVGDHTVNMARQVHQIVTGEDLKASV
jgi:phosphate transport system protein